MPISLPLPLCLKQIAWRGLGLFTWKHQPMDYRFWHIIGGVEDAVVDGQTGSLCDPNKPDQLQENLKELIEQPEKRENLGKAGIEWASKHSWKKMAKRLYELV